MDRAKVEDMLARIERFVANSDYDSALELEDDLFDGFIAALASDTVVGDARDLATLIMEGVDAAYMPMFQRVVEHAPYEA